MDEKKYELPAVTEWCQNCETEIELRWDVKTMGYQAFCPVCGAVLMLCDECRHSGKDGAFTDNCDWDSDTGRCKRSKPLGMKKYCVWVTSNQHGAVHVEATDPEDAMKQATELYNSRSVDWLEEKLTELDWYEE